MLTHLKRNTLLPWLLAFQSLTTMATPTPTATPQTPFYLPHEGRPHRAKSVIMALPGPDSPAYGEREILGIKNEITDIARAVSRFAPVTLLAHPRWLDSLNADTSKAAPCWGPYGVDVMQVDDSDLDVWMRDIAPTFVFGHNTTSNGSGSANSYGRTLHGIDFNFNGWGGRYPTPSSAGLARAFLERTSIARVDTTLVLEGGALETDGEGTLIATESSILNANRNAHLSRSEVEAELRRVLGVSKIIWLPGVRDQEVTDAHVDGWVRVIEPGVLLLNEPGAGAGKEVDRRVFEENRRILSGERDARGRPFKLVYVREAQADAGDDREEEGDLCLSYVNYLLLDKGVIVPRFGDRGADERAMGVFRDVFPEREIVQVFLEELAFSGGGIHCVTQQIPG